MANRVAHGDFWSALARLARKAGIHDRSLPARSRHLQTFVSDQGVERFLPAGTYEVITDEETIDRLSFAAFRRIATMILVPGSTSSTTEMISIGSLDLANAQRIDASTPDEKR
jgi:hypothetical protein